MLPAVLTLVAAGSGKANTEIPAAIGVCASGMAGLCCGIMLARRARALALKAAMFLAFSVLFGFVSLFLSFVGCALGEGLGRH